MTHLPRAILLAFPLVALAGKSANIVAGLGPKPTASLQLLPPRATARDGGFSSLSSGGPAAEAVGLLSVGAGDWRQASVDSRATPNRSAESLVNAGECAIAREAFKTGSPDRLLSAIEFVESRGRADAVGDGGRAVGILQIHRVMVDDCRRIAPGERFTYADRLSPERSRAMFRVFVAHYCKGYTNEQVARCWNGGPMGDRKPSTAPYWAKVQEAMK